MKNLNMMKSSMGFSKIKGLENYEDFSERIRKSLYYAKLPPTDRPSLPVTSVMVDKFGEFCKKDSLERLSLHEASFICYNACVTPCSVILALIYLERLRAHRPEYLSITSSSQIFLVALMVASKFLYDDGEEDEVYNDEWASSGAVLLSDLNEAERKFLAAIDWNLYLDPGSFVEGLSLLEAMVASKQTDIQGFFVYSDLLSLTRNLPVMSSLMNLVGSAMAFCFFSYTVTLLVVIGAGMIAREGVALTKGVFPASLEETMLPANISGSSMEDSNDVEETLLKVLQEDLEILDDVNNETDKPISQRSYSSKFSALRTFTTALLLASSNYKEDSGYGDLADSEESDCCLGCVHYEHRLKTELNTALRLPENWEFTLNVPDPFGHGSRYLPERKRHRKNMVSPDVLYTNDSFCTFLDSVGLSTFEKRMNDKMPNGPTCFSQKKSSSCFRHCQKSNSGFPNCQSSSESKFGHNTQLPFNRIEPNHFRKRELTVAHWTSSFSERCNASQPRLFGSKSSFQWETRVLGI